MKITTDRQVASLRPAAKPYEVGINDTRGLGLRVFPSGAKSFEFRYVAMNGKRRRLPLGGYPGLSLADARDKARALGVAVVDGADPAADRASKRAEARTGDTLTELAAAYFRAATVGLHGGRGRPKRASTLSMERSRFDLHISPRLGSSRFREIGRGDVRGFMRELAAEGGLAADTVASVGSTLSTILAFAVHEERLEANPATGLTRPLALRSRERMFSESALAAVWRALDAVPLAPMSRPTRAVGAASGAAQSLARGKADPTTALALQFAILTLARRGDVANAAWSEIDFSAGTWTIPAARFKGGRTHVVPLSSDAVRVLDKARGLHGPGSDFVFPSPSNPGRPITPHAIARALARTLVALGLPNGSPHDFRRTGATALTSEALGFRRFVVSKVLGHSAHDGAIVTEVYDRNEYLADKRLALNAWASLVVHSTEERPQRATVIPMRAARD